MRRISRKVTHKGKVDQHIVKIRKQKSEKKYKINSYFRKKYIYIWNSKPKQVHDRTNVGII